MEPFRISNQIRELRSAYPEAEDLIRICRDGGESARLAIARQWLSEGIPYAFKDCPAIYEALRSWVAMRLDVDSKEVNITGSARIGQSIAPYKLGKQFNGDSDLDIFIVNPQLFDQLKSDFFEWSDDFETNRAKPSNEREARFWKDNIIRCPRNINRGFIDSKYIPNHKKYQHGSNVSQTMFLLKEKLAITENAPNVSDASVRCYKSWKCYADQFLLSFK